MKCGILSGSALFAKTKSIMYLLEMITCDSLIYIMDHPDLSISNFMENFIGQKGLTLLHWKRPRLHRLSFAMIAKELNLRPLDISA